MADEADLGNDKAQDFLDGYLDEVRAHLEKREAEPTGFCLNPRCEEGLGDERLYCNAECAEEHARIKRQSWHYAY